MGLRRRITSRFFLPEINKISEERLCWDTIDKSKERYLDKNDNTPSSDLISKLPDDILLSILSSLSIRQTVCTSILSKRWKNLWRITPVKRLCFDATSMIGEEFDDDAFVRFVNLNLALHGGATIESFGMQRDLRPRENYGQYIDEWIEYAAKKRVEKLDINLSSEPGWEENDYFEKLFVFPYWLFDNQDRGLALKHLTLSFFKLDLPPKFNHFSSLISLTLKCVPLTQASLTNILSNCLSLEWLSMTKCLCSKSFKFTNGSSSSLKLKHLNISHCDNLQTADILDAEHLMSLEFFCWESVEFLLNDTAPVKRVCCSALSTTNENEWFHGAKKFVEDFPRLETLLLFTSSLDEKSIWNRPTFVHLKHLILKIVYREQGTSLLEPTISLLKASPLLQKLELHLIRTVAYDLMYLKKDFGIMKKKREEISSDSYLHANLKEVEIYSFHGVFDEVEAIEYLLNHTVILEKIKLDRKYWSYKGDGEWELESFQKLQIRKKTALRMLRKIIPSSTNFIVL